MQVQIQAKVTPITVPVHQLPEFICVDTVAVTIKYALQNNLQCLQVVSQDMADFLGIPNPNESKLKAHRGTMTDQTNPSRERSIQAVSLTTEIGIQCNMDANYIMPFKEPKKFADQRIKEEARFLTFVSEHTSMYPNGMLECLQCGEVSVSLKGHQYHMHTHYSTPALCWRCGMKIPSQSLMTKHLYNSCAFKTNPKPFIKFKCPHFACSVVTRSERHLSAHIAMHKGVYYYHCSKCRRGFISIASFFMHRKKTAECKKSKCIRLLPTHLRSTCKKDMKKCSVCQKSFSSSLVCAKHKTRCLTVHHKRMLDLLEKPHN